MTTEPERAVRPRRSFIFSPGLKPDMFPKALACGADIVCVELEDGIAPKDKAAARNSGLALFAAPQADDGVERVPRDLIVEGVLDCDDDAVDARREQVPMVVEGVLDVVVVGRRGEFFPLHIGDPDQIGLLVGHEAGHVVLSRPPSSADHAYFRLCHRQAFQVQVVQVDRKSSVIGQAPSVNGCFSTPSF